MIKVSHLVKNYGSFCAVDDVSFEVAKGEVVGFLGPNGAGKSTTMNVITGFLSSTSGTVTIGGIDILDDPVNAKKLIGYLPEQPPLYGDMTVNEYLNFAYDLKDCRQYDREKHIDEICRVVKISDYRNRQIKFLSKGYKQRVGIAQALVGNPPLIIFDEPTIGLDPKQIIEIRNLIRTLGREHTVILSTHILQEVQAVCDRIIIINRGKVVADEMTENIARVVENARRFNVKICGPQREVLSMLRNDIPGVAYAEVLAARDGDAYTYMVESEVGTDIRKKLFSTLAARGWPMIGLEALGMSIEDIFIAVVDKTDENEDNRFRTKKKTKSIEARRSSAEKEMAAGMVERAASRETPDEPEEEQTGKYYDDHTIKNDTIAEALGENGEKKDKGGDE